MFTTEQLNAVPAVKQFYSVPCLCQHLQLLPPQIIALAAQSGVDPDHFADGCPIYRGDAVEKLIDAINQVRGALVDADAKCRVSPSN